MVNFHYGDKTDIDAKVYKHHDNYPGGTDVALQKFFEEVEKTTKDTRFSDPEYLAARFICWALDKRLDTLGIGVAMHDHDDIEYLWFVDCKNHDDKGRPLVTYKKVRR